MPASCGSHRYLRFWVRSRVSPSIELQHLVGDPHVDVLPCGRHAQADLLPGDADHADRGRAPGDPGPVAPARVWPCCAAELWPLGGDLGGPVAVEPLPGSGHVQRLVRSPRGVLLHPSVELGLRRGEVGSNPLIDLPQSGRSRRRVAVRPQAAKWGTSISSQLARTRIVGTGRCAALDTGGQQILLASRGRQDLRCRCRGVRSQSGGTAEARGGGGLPSAAVRRSGHMDGLSGSRSGRHRLTERDVLMRSAIWWVNEVTK